MKATDIKPSKKIFALFVGKSGHGKDCAAFSFPTPMKVFDIDLRSDGGVFGTTWLSHEHKSQIDITYVYPNKGFSQIESELITLQLQASRMEIPYKTIYFGSVTSLSDLFLNESGRIISGQIAGKKPGIDAPGAGVRLSGPADYKYLYAAMRDVMDYLRAYPINVIVSAHQMDRYAKSTKQINEGGTITEIEDTYGESEVVGEKLALTDKLGEWLQIYFGEVYLFRKKMQGFTPKYSVQFRSDLAKTVHQGLPNGEIDITGKSFYDEWVKRVEGKK